MSTKETTESVSPTAHYTGYVWYHNKMGREGLQTRTGMMYYYSLVPLNFLAELTLGLSLEKVLLQRHNIIDYQLETAIQKGEIGQVVELACGLSPRGSRLTEKYPDLIYVETDLSDMIRNKENLIRENRLSGKNHFFRKLDVLSDDFTAALGPILKKDRGTAVITEGLINYFDRSNAEKVWSKIAAFLKPYKGSFYILDIHLKKYNSGLLADLAARALGVFVKSRLDLEFFDEKDLTTAMKKAGFREAEVLHPEDFHDRLKIPAIGRHNVLRLAVARP